MEQEILNLIYKFTYFYDENNILYVCYDRESKKIRYLKYLIENSINFKWYNREKFSMFSKKVICINKK
jgi:hypothetical protein